MSQAEVPVVGIEKGKAGFGLLANILIQKYDDHLPLYRQSEILESIEISRSTMAGWVAYGHSLLSTIAKEIKKYIFTSREIDLLHNLETG